MFGRVKDFFSKLVFCIRATGNISTFFTLVSNSKKFSTFSEAGKLSSQNVDEPAKPYFLNLQGLKRNIYLRTFSGDISVFYEVFWREIYKSTELNWKDFNCIIDVGANIGMATLFFKTLAPKANIIAIEPDQYNLGLLQKNVGNEKSMDNITLVHAAVADTDSCLSLVKSQFAYNTKTVEGGSDLNIKAISINTLVSNYSIKYIDLMKIDIEGFERRVFAENVDWMNLVNNIIIEIHSPEDFQVCITQMKSFGFSIKKMTADQKKEGIYLATKNFQTRTLID